MGNSNSSNHNRTTASKAWRKANEAACKKGMCPECKIKLVKFTDLGYNYYECPKCCSLFWS